MVFEKQFLPLRTIAMFQANIHHQQYRLIILVMHFVCTWDEFKSAHVISSLDSVSIIAQPSSSQILHLQRMPLTFTCIPQTGCTKYEQPFFDLMKPHNSTL